MRYLLLPALLALASAHSARANILPGPYSFEAAAREKQLALMRAIPPRPAWAGTVHVLRNSVFLDWRRPLQDLDSVFSGIMHITLVVDSTAQSSVVLDDWQLHLDSVRVNNVLVSATQPDQTRETCQIPYDRLHQPGDTLDIVIHYTRFYTATDTLNYRGFYLYEKHLLVGSGPGGDSIFTADRLAYTMSEPRDAHTWMPCIDDPSMKAPSEMRVLVPAGFQVSSNGLLADTLTSSQGTLWHWVENEPIATYLMCASASKFAMWSDHYVRVANANDTVPIEYFVWHVDSTSTDSSGLTYNARYSFRNLPRIMAGYSARFGEYPFAKYGMTPVQPFGYGGMEHQTMTTITRYWLRGHSEGGIAHELMHQWFGDDITCATWKDIWLNEGFATFGEAVCSEIMGGPAAYQNTVASQMAAYMWHGDFHTNIYDPEGQGKNVFNEATTYLKGGIVLHMLRRILGDSLYFATMRAYLARFHFGHATTGQFADFISTFTGQDLHWFVNEWVFGSWQPQYTVDALINNAVPRDAQPWVQFRIRQEDLTRPVFRMPITLRLMTIGGIVDTVVIDSTRDLTVRVHADNAIDTVGFDPDLSILKDSTIMTVGTWSGVAQNGTPTGAGLRLAVAPNPVSASAALFWSAPAGARHIHMDIVDMLGRIVASFTPVETDGGICAWDTRSVTPGAYLARLSAGAAATSTIVQVAR